MGIQVEEDDDEYILAPRKSGQQQKEFNENNLEVDESGNYLNQ